MPEDESSLNSLDPSLKIWRVTSPSVRGFVGMASHSMINTNDFIRRIDLIVVFITVLHFQDVRPGESMIIFSSWATVAFNMWQILSQVACEGRPSSFSSISSSIEKHIWCTQEKRRLRCYERVNYGHFMSNKLGKEPDIF